MWPMVCLLMGMGRSNRLWYSSRQGRPHISMRHSRWGSMVGPHCIGRGTDEGHCGMRAGGRSSDGLLL